MRHVSKTCRGCRLQVGGHLTSEWWKPRDGENIPGKADIQHSTVVLTVGETGWWMEDVTGCEDNQIMGIFSPPRHKYALRNNFIVPQPPHLQPSVWYLYSPNIGGERVHSVAVAN